MKRFDKDFRDEGGKRPFRPRGEQQSYARERGPRSGGYGNDSRPRFGRPQGGPREGYSSYRDDSERRGFDPSRREGGPRNTFRREGGPSGGYGRPPRSGASERPSTAAPQAQSAAVLVPAAKLKAGVREANRALAEVIEQFGHTLEGGYDISELEMTVSFGADGRFLGFGKGGAVSMTLSVTPLDSEALLEADEEAHVEMDEVLGGDDEESDASLQGFDSGHSELGEDEDDDVDVDALVAKSEQTPKSAKASKRPERISDEASVEPDASTDD